jgi:ABC-2 type transport system ATP-binding protein
MLEVKNVSKSFGAIRAVQDVSFTVRKGEILGFLGPNGAGKTTTMRMITGFLPPTSGTATVCGHDIIASPVAAKKCIGYLPENAPVYGDMTVTNFLLFVAGIRGFRGKAGRDKVEEIIKSCYLDRVRHQRVDTLSKGYKQRVCYAQAVLHDPRVLVMDEPTDGLDPNQKHTVRTMIGEMSREKAIIISTHILEEVEAICSRAIIISDGKIVANGTPKELKSQTPSGRLDDVFRKLTLGTDEEVHSHH